MKLSSIQPFAATPTPEGDSDVELEELAEESERVQPTRETTAPDASGEEEAREGLNRLADFLEHYKRRKKSQGFDRRSQVLRAYQQLDHFEVQQVQKRNYLDHAL